MGLLDKFKKKFDSVGKQKKPRNVVEDAKAEVKPDEHIEQKPKKAEKKASKEKRHDTRDAYRILHHALISEKASYINAHRQYVFAVSSVANKHQIADAVNRVYGVRPTEVRVLNVRGKDVRFGRISGRTSAWKKAIITLKEGESIDTAEGV